jgi:hypothetical protein
MAQVYSDTGFDFGDLNIVVLKGDGDGSSRFAGHMSKADVDAGILATLRKGHFWVKIKGSWFRARITEVDAKSDAERVYLTGDLAAKPLWGQS